MTPKASHVRFFLPALAAASVVLAAGCDRVPGLQSITVVPSTLTLRVNETLGLTTTGRFSNGSLVPLTLGLTWESSNPAVATVSTAGLVRGVAVGEARITVTLSGLSASASVTVTPPLLQSISVSPNPASVAVGTTVTLAVTATYSGGATEPLTSGVTFQSSNDAVATVDAAGVVTGVSAGTATVTATETASSKTATATVNVTPAGAGPASAPPAPTQEAGDVISLFSAAYTDVAVDTWLTSWSPNQTDGLTDPYPIPGLTPTYNVKKYVLASGSGNYAGIEFIANQIDATAMTHFRMDVWSDDPVASYRVKLVDFGADASFGGGDDTEATATVALAAGQWNQLDLPLSSFVSAGGSWNRAHLAQMVIEIADPASGGTVYVDNIYFYKTGGTTDGGTTDGGTTDGGTLAQMDLPVTFDDPGVDYGLVGFGGADDSSIVVDPTGGPNMVAKVVKSATAELWAGTTITKAGNPQPGFANKIPFAAGATKMTMRVYSPDAGIPVRLKAEDSTNASISVETEATTTQAGAWETLTFDFANHVSGTAPLNLANSYNKVSIFFNFGTTGATAGEKTYYFDDVAFAGGTTDGGTTDGGTTDGGMLAQMDLPVTFDDPGVDYGLIGFGGADDSTIVVDPTGGPNMVAKVVKSGTAELWAGTTITANGTPPPGLANKIPFAAGATTMTVRVYSADAGIPVRLKVEDYTNGSISVETEATTTQANAWETLTFDFANHVSGTPALNLASSYNKVSIFFNFGTDGATAGEKTYYFDDVAFGGGTPTDGGTTTDGGMAEGPTSKPAAPTQAAGDVISLYSAAYTDVPVDTWLTTWSPNYPTGITDPYPIPGVTPAYNVKKYVLASGSGNYAGIEFTTNQIDASQMTHFRMDVWSDAPVQNFQVKLVDFGANAVYDGGDDTNATATASLTGGQWNTLDIPLSSFVPAGGTWNRGHLAQMIIEITDPASGGTVYVDNIYFYKAVVPGPTSKPAVPTQAPGDVLSLFSAAYSSVTVDTWLTTWSPNYPSGITDPYPIPGVSPQYEVKKYELGNQAGNYAGIEFTSNTIDATLMTHFRMDVWSDDPVASFKIKLVDFGADGAYGGGDDTEATATVSLSGGQWNNLDIPLSSFVPAASSWNRGHLAQMIIEITDPASGGTVYLDNIYFYKTTVSGPTSKPAAPTQAAGDVISLFSAAYTDVTVDTWLTPWSPNQSDGLTDPYPIPGVTPEYNVKKYVLASQGGNFAGIEFTSNTIDATQMTHFRMDVWSDDPVASFKIKLVDFGANGTYDGGDDTEASATVSLSGGQWNNLDIPLSSFVPAASSWNRGHLAQMIIEITDPASGGTVYVDNIYFYLGAPTEPAAAAATPPTRNAADVISLYNSSSTYSNVPVDTFRTDWSVGTLSDFTISGTSSVVKKYSGVQYVGVDFFNPKIDASSMTHLHVDLWTPDATKFGVKLVSFPTAGGTVEYIVGFNTTTTPAISQGSWVSLDIPLSSFTGVPLDTLGQLLWLDNQDVSPGGAENGTFFIDNVYFYKQ